MPDQAPLPGTLNLNQAIAPQVPEGAARPFAPGEWLANPNGSWSSEITVTVTDPRLNGGQPTVIPSLWIVGGKPVKVPEDTAVEFALQSGLQFQGFPSMDAAEQFANQRETVWQGMKPHQAGTVPPLWQTKKPLSPQAQGVLAQPKPPSGLDMLGR